MIEQEYLDEWDKFPDVPPPCYPFDEASAENKRIEELREKIRADYERRLNESSRQWKPALSGKSDC